MKHIIGSKLGGRIIVVDNLCEGCLHLDSVEAMRPDRCVFKDCIRYPPPEKDYYEAIEKKE